MVEKIPQTQYTFFLYKKPDAGPSSKSFLFFLIFLVKNVSYISIKVASSESFCSKNVVTS